MTADHIIEKIREPYSEPPLTCPHIDRLVEGGEMPASVLDELFAIREINSQLRYGTWVLKARAEAAEAERDALRKAMAPFKFFADAYDEDQLRRNGVDPRKYDLSDKATVATSGIFGNSTWRVITAGDCRHARTLAGDNHE